MPLGVIIAFAAATAPASVRAAAAQPTGQAPTTENETEPVVPRAA
ncbi:hypothetical protein [Amycolatopsis regifaucium]|nr:hypothetical protein [Amycolatopsis regifaucium]